MTARRQAANPFDTALTARRPGRTTAAPAEALTASPGSAEGERMSKYTLLLDSESATGFDGLALAARRQLGRRVDKSQIVRALLALAADDATLRQQLVDELRRQRDI